MSIKAVIFDLGNVLIDFDHKIAAERISRHSSKAPQEIYDIFFDSELTCFFEEGKISPSDFFLQVKEILNLKISYDKFVPIWNEIFFLSEKNRFVYNAALILKKKYKTAVLSNINTLHFEYLLNHFPVFDAFHKVITSFQEGTTKPNSLIYQNTLAKLDIQPCDAFYTDDRLELVEKAKELGIRGFHFQGIDKLKKDFLSTGIKLD